MNKGVIAAAVVAALAAGGGYWAGQKSAPAPHAAGATNVAADSGKKERKILFYRNPMGLPDTSPTPKKDPMGMDYIAVYEGEQDDEPASANQIKISTEKIQKLGVRTEAATLRNLDKVVRAAGRIEPDERRTYTISPKFEGYVERLHVNVTGQPVSKGQPLFEVYSPELVSAQREYAIAVQGQESLKGAESYTQDSMRQLAESSLARLRNWDISEEQVKSLAKSGETRRTLTFRSPVNGIITEKKAVQGMRFMPGEALYQVADLSSVWAIADVFEQDIGLVKSGGKAKVKINAYPDKTFEGTISYVYPTLKAETRTIQVRIDLPNTNNLLKPGMFAQLELPTTAKGAVVTVPNSAVIDSGTRQIVLVQAKEGRFEPREVKLGARSDDRVEVIDGVRDGEQVVVAANFLIDAESNLKAAIGGFGHSGHGAAAPSDKPAAATVGNKAEGKVEEVDAKAGTVSITHGPVPSLKWPGMTMEFKPANEAIMKQLKPGAAIDFEFVERGQGEWVITSVQPASQPAGKANPHAGH
ncbi:efflux RND transporter periplasmic adaptor subunit [Ferribacterium limneticum]|uniref:efflux RND transporter periplasmic adaptor subunit n=1 Tax=Ferribacterium limneticum TaxID=76259 RepID=UPI001CF903D1|nr:efflux RND transporter periplasmic adaptor subunit [Ferribacterium limneticum]UCV22330.1 efflux RND transporter periplasmic adaptor subunit [Ferribacterium limneticum]